jgi:4-amino-4-deoxy-L-arabinose transferase-like glycosyltransferase
MASRAREVDREGRYETMLRAIVIVYLMLGALYAVLTPPWQVPDEPAHYNYVEYIATHAQLPELRPGDYPTAYLEEIKARRFPPEMSIAAIRYESHQPPLYYLLGALLYRLNDSMARWPMLLVLRAFSVLLGGAGVALAYRLVRGLCPDEPHLALGTAAFVGTLPMHVAMTAAVNNDALSNLLLLIIVWRVLPMDAAQWTPRRAVGLGALLGLAFLTKLQSTVAFGVTLAALAWDTWAARRTPQQLSWRAALGRAAILLGVALLVSSPWLGRNLALYSPLDPLGLGRHDAVVEGQLTTRAYLAQYGWGTLASAFLRTTFQSFWGQFGWMGVLLDARLYLALGLLSAWAGGGFALYALGAWRARVALAPRTQRGMLLFVLWAALTTAGYLWWNGKFLQHQGRYLFPALVPLGLAFTLGLREWWRRPLWSSLALLGLGVVALVAWGAFTGDMHITGVALLLAAMTAVSAGHFLERRWPGVVWGIFYAGMAALTVFCLYGAILPALRG